MGKMSIAELREAEVRKLAAMGCPEPSEGDVAEARRLMNSFYRLCGLCERNLYLANDARTCNRRSTKQSEEKEHKWWKRLDAAFTKKYGLQLVYCGYCPSIGTVGEHHAFSEKITRWFYQ